jgi:hypothetical protein
MKNFLKPLFLISLLACAVNLSAVKTPVKHIIPDSIANRSFGELLTKFGNKQKYKYWQCMSCFGIAEQYYNDTLYLNGHPIVAEWGDSTKYRSIAKKELHRTWFRYWPGDGDPSGYYIAAIDTADNLIYIDTDEKFLSFIGHNNTTQKIAILTALNHRNFVYSKKDSAYVYYEDQTSYYFNGWLGETKIQFFWNRDLKTFEEYWLDNRQDRILYRNKLLKGKAMHKGLQ